MKKNKAFTLIELLIVVAIVGLLISIVTAFLNDAKQKGKDTEKINSMSEVRRALQMYAVDYAGFPSATTSGLITGGYISSINPAILYVGRNNSGGLCSSGICPSYHLAVPLDNIGTPVLLSDSDQTTGTAIYGNSTNCLSAGGPDKCYDITP
jgi:prepilin-type N-terminal cleavage/methylation domain-containing protein